MARFTSALARACATRPWRTVSIWLVLLLAGLASSATLLSSALTTEGGVTANVEGKVGFDLLDKRLSRNAVLGGEVVVVRHEALTVEQPAFRQFVEGLAADVRSTGKVGQVVTTYATRDASLVSADAHATLMTVFLADADKPETVTDVVEVVGAADREAGFAVDITGSATLGRDFMLTSQRDLQRGELYFGFPAALLVLLLVFGAAVAAGLPVLMAMVCIPVSIGIAALVGQLWSLSFFVTEMVVAMGLALGIDYSLFVVSRYREERRLQVDKLEAILRASSTASVAVTFSALSFTVALTGLLLVPDVTLRSLAAGAIIVGLVTLAASLTLLPALLSLLGDRVDALRLPWARSARHTGGEDENRRWLASVRFVMRHAGVVLAGTIGVLLLASLPVLHLNTGQLGVASLPDRLVAKQGYLAIQRDFPSSGRTDPARIVVPGDTDSPRVTAAIDALRARLSADPTFAANRVTRYAEQRLTVVDVALPGDPAGGGASTELRRLRAQFVHPTFAAAGVPAYVTGTTAYELDYAELIDTWLPRVIAFVLALTFVLLTLVFRSLVLSLKAVLLNLLSVGAAYGLLVLVFQDGVGAGLLGLTQAETVEPWVPVFLFSVLFALSMDYHVFLLSRIRERYARTGDTQEAVAHGIASTGRLITGAALIIVVVFAGFATGDLVGFQQMGFGVAVALLIDATVVRSIVVPSAMVLLGRWNWYLPGWMAWLPELQVAPTGPEPRGDGPAPVALPTPRREEARQRSRLG